jgi:O-antigen ligase
MPFSAVNLTALAGDLGMNLLLVPMLLLMPFILLRILPFPAVASEPYGELIRALFLFFVWCAFTTLVTGMVFEFDNLSAYGSTPLRHSLARFPIPIFIGLLAVASYGIGRHVLTVAQSDKVLCTTAVLLASYGLVQLYGLYASPQWYFSLVSWIEGARNLPGPWQPDVLSYVHLTGRLNLTTFEAAEAARLVLIAYVPALVTPAYNRLGAVRIATVSVLVLLVLLAQTIVGLVCLSVLAVIGFVVLNSRLRYMVAVVSVVFLLLAIVAAPASFTERISGIAATRDVDDLDQSILTRASFAVASLQVTLAHPLLGIGWSKDIFFLQPAIPEWGHSWEVEESLENGEAVAAKSMAIRLLLYAGIPAFLLLALKFVRTAVHAVQQYRRDNDPLALRVVLVMVMFAVGGVCDGGILVGAYSWVSLGLVMGMAAAKAGMAKEI